MSPYHYESEYAYEQGETQRSSQEATRWPFVCLSDSGSHFCFFMHAYYKSLRVAHGPENIQDTCVAFAQRDLMADHGLHVSHSGLSHAVLVAYVIKF